jgi:hypothetical protein
MKYCETKLLQSKEFNINCEYCKDLQDMCRYCSDEKKEIQIQEEKKKELLEYYENYKEYYIRPDYYGHEYPISLEDLVSLIKFKLEEIK